MVPLGAHHGVGLRSAHFAAWLDDPPAVGLVEAITENFAGRGGRPLHVLERARRDADVVLHGVSLGVGDLAPLRKDELRRARALADDIEAAWMSDHLCFTGFGGHVGHDLWPLPFTEEAIAHVVTRVAEVQDVLGRRIALENVSSYVTLEASAMAEWEFLSAVAERADCDLLLDLNNVLVNAHNHGFDPYVFVAQLPTARLRQLHLAGHSDMGTHLFDDHRGPVPDGVWDLYRYCTAVHGAVPSVVEWDTDVPSLPRLVEESRRAATVEAEVLAARGAA